MEPGQSQGSVFRQVILVTFNNRKIVPLSFSATFGAITYSPATNAPYMKNIKEAAQRGNQNQLMELIEAGINVNNISHPPNTVPRFCRNVWNVHDANPLRLATACNRSFEVVRTIITEAENLGEPINVDERNNEGFTALMYAADNGNVDSVRFLLDKGADIEARNEEGYTPLIYAAWSGHNSTAKLLLDRGANVNARNRRGYTPLILAAHNGFADVACLLIDNGANINARNVLGHSALVYAARFGYADAARLLLSKGASHRGCRYELCHPKYGSMDDWSHY